VVEALERALHDVETGDLDARTGTALATIAVAITRVFAAGEAEERLQAVERSVAEWQHSDRAKFGGWGA
jgi:hypothetical protein